MSADYRSEYGAGPGSPPDAARSMRRHGLAERSGNTGAYVRRDQSDDSTDPIDDAYAADMRAALRSLLSDDA